MPKRKPAPRERLTVKLTAAGRAAFAEARCEHSRSVLLARDAVLYDRSSDCERGAIRWCVRCGAIRGELLSKNGPWIDAGSERWLSLAERDRRESAEATHA